MGSVFRSPRGNGALTARQINRIVAAAGARAGVKHPDPTKAAVTCHLFRHSFARRWKKARESIESLADRHSSSTISSTH